MKTKRTILLAFLLMLYIGPSLFAMTSYSLPSPTPQNSSKEFSLSTYGDESPDSITSFGETLPDDTLFYPDGTELERDDSPTDGGVYSHEGGDSAGTCWLDANSDADNDADGLLLNGDGLNGIGAGGGVITDSNGPIRFHLVVTVSAYSEGAGSEMYLT
ncbi:MAG TPA: hypothetical protein VMW50_12790, partial [Dehalococcoidia bacterium]|nr:hypothetical protein [Dehalococcoidia bacterium]